MDFWNRRLINDQIISVKTDLTRKYTKLICKLSSTENHSRIYIISIRDKRIPWVKWVRKKQVYKEFYRFIGFFHLFLSIFHVSPKESFFLIFKARIACPYLWKIFWSEVIWPFQNFWPRMALIYIVTQNDIFFEWGAYKNFEIISKSASILKKILFFSDKLFSFVIAHPLSLSILHKTM